MGVMVWEGEGERGQCDVGVRWDASPPGDGPQSEGLADLFEWVGGRECAKGAESGLPRPSWRCVVGVGPLLGKGAGSGQRGEIRTDADFGPAACMIGAAGLPGYFAS